MVAEELYAGAIDRQALRLIERYLGSLERAGRVVVPTFQDWQDAGAIIARITRKQPNLKSKTQQVLNDILIAISARRIGADIYTFNASDFELIRRHRQFTLKILKE